jgi:hypothetical protein
MDTIEFCGEIRTETEKACCVFDGKEEVWIPKSAIKERRPVKNGSNRNCRDCVLTIPEWVAKKKGII